MIINLEHFLLNVCETADEHSMLACPLTTNETLKVPEFYRAAMNHTILTTIDLVPFTEIKVNRRIKAMLIVSFEWLLHA